MVKKDINLYYAAASTNAIIKGVEPSIRGSIPEKFH